MSRPKRLPVYAAPALEKGLDILECLAEQRVSLTQTQLARVLRRSPSELFRMLSCLEQRAYIRKDPVSGAYALSLRLFELSRTHSPYEHLTKAASRPMQALAESVHESCHLSVLHGARLLIVAQQESPEKIRLCRKPLIIRFGRVRSNA
jgi:DNA-binding IclR family transcriptional regulator